MNGLVVLADQELLASAVNTVALISYYHTV